MRQGNHEHITIMVLVKGIPGKKPRVGPRIRWIDSRPIRIDVETYGPDDQMTKYRNLWSNMVATIDTL